MAEDIHALQAGRTARMDSKPRDGRRSADWLEGWDQTDVYIAKWSRIKQARMDAMERKA